MTDFKFSGSFPVTKKSLIIEFKTLGELIQIKLHEAHIKRVVCLNGLRLKRKDKTPTCMTILRLHIPVGFFVCLFFETPKKFG